LTLELSCAMKFEAYPHDTQNCSMMIESLSHTVDDLIFLWNITAPLVVSEDVELPQLDIVESLTEDCTLEYSTEMGKSRAEYMRNYKQKKKKPEEKLKTGGVRPKKIAHNSTQRSRDFRASAANAILSQTSTADLTIAIPNLFASHATVRMTSLPLSYAPSTSIASVSNTGSEEIHQHPADAEQG
ncbi:glycine receptor subunit alpha-2, partial [Trichonephila inaurata madagascariensis]